MKNIRRKSNSRIDNDNLIIYPVRSGYDKAQINHKFLRCNNAIIEEMFARFRNVQRHVLV